jgi:hypothetical protein
MAVHITDNQRVFLLTWAFRSSMLDKTDSMKKNISRCSLRFAPQMLGLLVLSGAGFTLLLAGSVQAGYVKFVDESFTGDDGPRLGVCRKACTQHPKLRLNHGASLTAASGGPDPEGSGWLRLTRDAVWQSSFVHYTGQEENWKGIPTKWGLVFEFDFVIWRAGSSHPGDGFALVIFDANVEPSPGAYGGSLGYAQRSVNDEAPVPGLAGGVVGIGFDAFGWFSRANEGRVLGPGERKDSVAIRGSVGRDSEGNENRHAGYAWQAGTAAGLPNFSKTSATSREAATIHAVRITIPTTQRITIEWHQGDGNWQPVLEHNCTLVCPEFIKFGFTAGHGQCYRQHRDPQS